MAESTTIGDDQDTVGKVIDSVRKHSDVKELQFASDGAAIKAQQVEGAAYVFRASREGDDGCSVVVKYSAPYIKCGGADVPLGQERGELEFRALTKFASLCPGSVPNPLFYDTERKMLCVEDLREYKVYRTDLIRGNLDDQAALKLIRDMAVIHRDTHVAKIGEDAIKALDSQFENSTMKTLTERYVFTAPFSQGEASNRCSEDVREKLDWVYGDQEVVQGALNMKQLFLEKKESLILGDLHTGSVMVNGSDSKIVDGKFACVGPCAFDVGILIANYIFTYYTQLMTYDDNDTHRAFAYRVVELCSQSVEEYFQHMTSFTGDPETYQAKFISDVAGFAGCEIIRRLVGAVHVADFDHTPHAEQDALGAGVRLLKAYHRIHSIGTLLLIALMLA